jgi:D-serine deaminase-like pyridoxal phosphate-dependent protein
MPFEDIDTPALIVDLDAFERNLRKMAEAAAGAGVRFRPHAKTHKSPVIARRQMALGAVGVCCQKVSEAEILVAGGVDDVLVSNQVIGASKIARLAALARQARLGVCVDDLGNVTELAEAAHRFGAPLDVLVEIDIGMGRCGVPPGAPALKLAEAIVRTNVLRFAGLQAYHGSAQHIRKHADRREAIARAAELAASTAQRIRKAGIACDTITGAGTGTYEFEASSGVYTELQAGSYIFMDADYARNLEADGSTFRRFEHALFVLTSVMSRAVPGRAVVDAGLKASSVDSGLPEPWQLAGARYVGASDEHGVLEFTGRAPAALALGRKIMLVPGHCDPTVNLHDWYVGVRGLAGKSPHVETLWPVAARGAGF